MVFNFLKAKENASPEPNSQENAVKKGWFDRLSSGLARTRKEFTNKLSRILLGKKNIDAALFKELETLLLSADVGLAVSQKILNQLTEKVARKELSNPETLLQTLKQQLLDQLQPYCSPLVIDKKPFVILVVGVNGTGKTTSIAKIAHYFQSQNKKVMLAAGDTFRAAAIEQLQTWGERNQVPVIAQHSGADSASVIYDAMQAATARNIDILIADTAGRLHTQQHLMSELQKIKRVLTKLNVNAPQETLLVIDASIGQNALSQAEQFNAAIGLTGLVVTKLDGTAKGGIVFAITEKLKLPIRFVGVGEQIDDLKTFDANEFVEALFGE